MGRKAHLTYKNKRRHVLLAEDAADVDTSATEPEEEGLAQITLSRASSPRFMPGKRRRPTESVEPNLTPSKRTERMLKRKPSSSAISRDSSPTRTPIKSSSLADLALLGTPPIRTPSDTATAVVSAIRSAPIALGPSPSPSPSPRKAATIGPGSTRTYAQSRSFLIEASTSKVKIEDASLSAQVDALVQPAQSYVDMKTKWGIESDDEDETDALGLKGINALRAQGQNKRFDDELAYILDGLNPLEALGSRRSSAMELLKKCVQGPDFMRKVRMSGYAKNLYRHLSSAREDSKDIILDVCLALFLAIVFRDNRDATSLDQLCQTSSPLMPFLLSCLTRPLASEAIYSTNEAIYSTSASKALSKLERTLLASLRPVVDSAKLWADDLVPPKKVTLRRLGLSVLVSIAVNRPHSIPGISQHTARLLLLLESMLDPFLQSTEDALTDLDFAELEALLSVLELCTPPTSAPDLKLASEATLAVNLSAFLHLAFKAACSDQVEQASAAMDCLLTLLKFLINATHLSSSLSCALVDQPATYATLISCLQSTADAAQAQSQDTGMPALKLDLLSLCLGLLSNLFEANLANRLCFLDAPCGPGCQDPGVPCLARLFALYAEPSSAGSQLVRCYLCTLLGLLRLGLDGERQGTVDGTLRQELSAGAFAEVVACTECLQGPAGA